MSRKPEEFLYNSKDRQMGKRQDNQIGNKQTKVITDQGPAN